MEQVQTLIEKFNSGTASLAEQQELLSLLSTNAPELEGILATSYYQNLAAGNADLSPEKSKEIFELIQAQKDGTFATEALTNKKAIKSIGRWTRWAAAASVVAITLIGAWFISKPDDNQTVATKTATTQPILQQLSNKSAEIKSFTLPDGTTVLLSPNSAISFYQPFVKSRDINLIGEATFKVAKDAAKPFSVYANNVVTTALGTIFKVSSNNKSVKVILIEGKVVVRPKDNTISFKDSYLQPGEQFAINKATGVYAISNTIAKKEPTRKTPIAGNNKQQSNLAFNKTPLTEVFTQIGNRYNVLIQYNKEELQNLSFTGSFIPSDSLQTILTIICNTNDLSYKLDSNVVIISKQ